MAGLSRLSFVIYHLTRSLACGGGIYAQRFGFPQNMQNCAVRCVKDRDLALGITNLNPAPLVSETERLAGTPADHASVPRHLNQHRLLHWHIL